LYIVGAGAFGRDVLDLVKDINALNGPRWKIMGFLDDTKQPRRDRVCNYSVCGTIQDYNPQPEDELVMAIASPVAKSLLVPMLLSRGAVFASCIHPTAAFKDQNTMSKGLMVFGGFGIPFKNSPGNFLSLMGPGFGYGITVGDYSTILTNIHVMEDVSIGKSVFVDANVVIAPGVHVGDGAFICMGSTVMNDVPEGARVSGNPAVIIG